ncbi:hypothetical protein ACV566_09750 [Staphylococcus aureus]
MSLEVVSLSTLLRNFTEKEVQLLLDQFESKDFSGKNEAHEEDFLKNKLIMMIKMIFLKRIEHIVVIKVQKF